MAAAVLSQKSLLSVQTYKLNGVYDFNFKGGLLRHSLYCGFTSLGLNSEYSSTVCTKIIQYFMSM
jgi:hypothetical protein